jgi:DNA polymerase III, epsilon subunit and related 3''-5'' exonucleases
MNPLFARGAVAVDIEGDGNAPLEPVEITVVGFDLDTVDTPLTWRINPGRHISPFATRVHGLRDSDVRYAPAFPAVAAAIEAAISGKAVVGHAVHNDMHVLRRKLPGLETGPVLDTQKMARQLVPGHKSYGLHRLAADLGLEVAGADAGRGAHSAAYDALLTIGLFRHLAAMDGASAWLRSCGVTLDQPAGPAPA